MTTVPTRFSLVPDGNQEKGGFCSLNEFGDIASQKLVIQMLCKDMNLVYRVK